jgi:septum formation inhibitor MinC
MEAFLYSCDLNLWGEGPPRYVPSTPWKNRKDLDPDDWETVDPDINKLKNLTGDRSVNPYTLFWLRTGMERSLEYFTVFLKNGSLSDPDRSETKVSLALLNPDAEAVGKASADKLRRWVSVDSAFLMKRTVISVKELKKDLKHLNSQIPDKKNKIKPKENDDGKVKKDQIVAAVIEARRYLIALETDWKEKRVAEIHDTAQLQVASSGQQAVELSTAEIEKELDSQYYSFNDTDAREKYSKHDDYQYEFDGTLQCMILEDDDDPMPPPSPSSSPEDRGAGVSASKQTNQSTPSTAGRGYSGMNSLYYNYN